MLCGCLWFDWDGENDGDGVVKTCTCGHVDDEHEDDRGPCQVEFEGQPA